MLSFKESAVKGKLRVTWGRKVTAPRKTEGCAAKQMDYPKGTPLGFFYA